MHWFFDFTTTNKTIIQKTNRLMGEHTLLMYVGLIYVPFLWAVNYFASRLPLFGGLIWFFALAMVASNYFYLIDLAVKGYKSSWQDVKEGFFVYSRKLFNMFFILWVVNLGVNLLILPLLPGFLGLWVGILYWFGAVILLNALPEVVYQKTYGELDAIKYAMAFQKKNILNWYIPNIALMAVVYGFQWGLFRWILPLLVSLPYAVAVGVTTVLFLILVQFIAAYAMIYRGQLFQVLDTTSRQRRIMKITH